MGTLTARSKVKNLGWLLRNWQSIESIHFNRLEPNQPNSAFSVLMTDGRKFDIEYAAFELYGSGRNGKNSSIMMYFSASGAK